MNKSEVFAWLDNQKMELAGLLSELVQKETVNQGEPETADERPGQEYVAGVMRQMGLEVQELAFDRENKRPNVVGILPGTGGGQGILFNAHMDVVPINEPENWQYPPFGGVIRDGRVYGRGACDDKMGVAAMVYAVKALQAAGIALKGDVYLLSSVGEESCEGGTVGPGPVVRALREQGRVPTCAVVGELTDLQLQVESASLFFFEVAVKGKTCHVGWRNQCVFPQPYGVPSGGEAGVDALQKLLPIIEMFYRKERDWALNTMRSDVLGNGRTAGGVGAFTLNPCRFSGGGYIGSVPAEASVTYSVWFSNAIAKEEMMREIQQSIDAVCQNDSWLREHPPEVRMPIIQDWPGFKTPADSELVGVLGGAWREVMGREPEVSGFKAACDATWIAMEGVPSVVLGPGTLDNRVHTVDEYCDIDELVTTAKLYASMMIDWCERPA